MKEGLSEIIGIRMQAARKECGLTQEQLAEAIGKTVETVSNIERGVKLPALATLHTISQALNLELSDLAGNLKKRSRSHQEVYTKALVLVNQLSEKKLLRLLDSFEE